MTSIDELRQQADRHQQRYAASFAGHPRITRNPDLLRTIIGDLEGVRAAASSAGFSELTTSIDRTLESYRTEVARVDEAKRDGPLAMSASRAMTWGQFGMNRYRRNYAGRSRIDRDIGLLKSILANLETVEANMARLRGARPTDNALANAHDASKRNLEMYRTEVRAIRDVQNSGATNERAGRFANLANAQFTLYRFHFAGKSRLSRSPELLERLLDNLGDFLAGMRSLKLQGLNAPANDKNISVVESNMSAWRTELEAIRAAVRDASSVDRAGALGQAANERFEEYRAAFANKPRTQVDLDLLGNLLEDLLQIARGMDALDADDGDDRNAANLQIVLDRIRLYEREYGRIEEARKGAAN
ncbi:MAG: hypothetical protein ACI8PZ_002960 [Myxococcota bacterium]|jgi:hypothetical protein